MELITSDYWKAYETIVPKAKQLSKNETKIKMLFKKQENAGAINAFANA